MGRYVEASPESLLGVLRALQAPVESLGDVADALRERQEELAGRMAEPVVVAWDGHAPSIEVRMSSGANGNGAGSLAWHLDLEGGERRAQMARSRQPAADGARLSAGAPGAPPPRLSTA